MKRGPESTKRYGIEDVLVLLRELPLDQNPELVMRVVRKTLESKEVRVDELVAEAKTTVAKLEKTIETERATIAQLEREIASRQSTVAKLAKEIAEMKQAGQRLSGDTISEWDRPSVMRLEDGDIEPIASPEPGARKSR